MKPHRGTLILILGILSLVVCQPVGILAWILGNTDLKEMANGVMDPEGRGLTQAGKILGIVAVVFMAIAIVIGVLTVVLGVGAAAMAPSN